MTGRNANIYFSEFTYQKLRQTAGTKISRFMRTNSITEEARKKKKSQY